MLNLVTQIMTNNRWPHNSWISNWTGFSSSWKIKSNHFGVSTIALIINNRTQAQHWKEPRRMIIRRNFYRRRLAQKKNKLFLDTEINHSMAVLTSIAWHMTLISSSTIQNNWHWWINRPDPTISLRTKLGKDLFANHTFIENSKFTFANFDTSRGTQASTLFMAAAEPTSSLVKQGTTGFEK